LRGPCGCTGGGLAFGAQASNMVRRTRFCENAKLESEERGYVSHAMHGPWHPIFWCTCRVEQSERRGAVRETRRGTAAAQWRRVALRKRVESRDSSTECHVQARRLQRHALCRGLACVHRSLLAQGPWSHRNVLGFCVWTVSMWGGGLWSRHGLRACFPVRRGA